MEKKEYFCAEVTPNQMLYKEAYKAIIWHSWRPLLYICIVLAGLFMVGKSLYIGDYEDPFNIYFLFLVGFIIWRLLSAPERAARKSINRISAVYGNNTEITVAYSFRDNDYHTHTASGGDIDTAYDQIKSVYETSHGIILYRTQNLFEILDKNSIQGGSLHEFREFLEKNMSETKFFWKNKK